MIVLTSFFEGAKLPHEKWSGARFAPQQMKDWPVADWAQPFYPDTGRTIYVSDFKDIEAYFSFMVDLYQARWDKIQEWLDSLKGNVVLACWCPYTKAAKAEIEKHGTFMCHLLPIGYCFALHGVNRAFAGQHATKLVQF